MFVCMKLTEHPLLFDILSAYLVQATLGPCLVILKLNVFVYCLYNFLFQKLLMET